MDGARTSDGRDNGKSALEVVETRSAERDAPAGEDLCVHVRAVRAHGDTARTYARGIKTGAGPSGAKSTEMDLVTQGGRRGGAH